MPVVVSANGKLIPEDSAGVSIFDRGFLYGDSVYETLRSHRGLCLHLDRHLERLTRSADLLGIRMPIGTRELGLEIIAAAAVVGAEDIAVRVMITRGEGPVGIDPRTAGNPNRFVIARPLPPPDAGLYNLGVKVVIARTVRNSSRALNPEIKSGNFLNNILSMREAIAADAFEAIMLNADGNVAEATQSNVFGVRAGVVFTPDPRAGLLRGITRQVVVDLCRQSGIQAEERDVFVSELYEADELFLTSTLKSILPVTWIGGRAVGDGRPGPLTTRLRLAYDTAIADLLRGFKTGP